MDPQAVRKTYKYKLKPRPEQERSLERTLMLCRHVYNAAIGERREAWRMRGVSLGTKSISDAGWSAFLLILSYKAAWAGRRVVAVNPAFTSQTCSGCGVLVAKGLSVRWHSCPECGTNLHRDHGVWALVSLWSLLQLVRGRALQPTGH